jgi:hypothetical protein
MSQPIFSVRILTEVGNWKQPTGFEEQGTIQSSPQTNTISNIGHSQITAVSKKEVVLRKDDVLAATLEKMRKQIAAKKERFTANINEIIPDNVADKDKLVDLASQHFDVFWELQASKLELQRQSKMPKREAPPHIKLARKGVDQKSLEKSIRLLSDFDSYTVNVLRQALGSQIKSINSSIGKYHTTTDKKAAATELADSYRGYLKGFEQLRELFLDDAVVKSSADILKFSKTLVEEIISLNIKLKLCESYKQSNQQELKDLVSKKEFTDVLIQAKDKQTQLIKTANEFMNDFAKVIALLQSALTLIEPTHPDLKPTGNLKSVTNAVTSWIWGETAIQTTDFSAFSFPGILKKDEVQFVLDANTIQLPDYWFEELYPSPMPTPKSDPTSPPPPTPAPSPSSSDGTSTGTPGLGTSQVGS